MHLVTSTQQGWNKIDQTTFFFPIHNPAKCIPSCIMSHPGTIISQPLKLVFRRQLPLLKSEICDESPDEPEQNISSCQLTARTHFFFFTKDASRFMEIRRKKSMRSSGEGLFPLIEFLLFSLV
ncbi:hypothetical protein HJG60_010086 [Phyllostomus discolor]|uniref:Uncharacterized protein n=1 Tax=Phyllostomus discolor TaxID=89673 RepID=A0A834EMH6_9CHIR|nr:hypothetical protein HJG60_010086 [Phyllostomus discolor]